MNRWGKQLSVVIAATAFMMTTGACAGPRTAGTTISDASITASVKTRLLADQRTDGLKIDVDTQSGVVYLGGEVKNSEEVRLAEAIAKRVDGVASVENNLRVSPN